MPINKNAYKRYTIIDRLLSQHCDTTPCTKQRIITTIKQELELNGYSERQLQYDFKEIENLWNTNIKFAGKVKEGNKYVYSYKYDEEHGFSVFEKKMPVKQKEHINDLIQYIETFKNLPQLKGIEDSLSNLKAYITNENAKKIFFIEENPHLKGIEKLPILARHIKDDQELIVYTNSVQYGNKTYIVLPKVLKQYNKRWYLFAYTKIEGDFKLYNFPIDNIEKLSITQTKNFDTLKTGNKYLDWDKYFNQFIGVTNPTNTEIQKVKIAILNKHVQNILKNNPLHCTQTEEYNDLGQTILSFELKPNRELLNTLLKYTDSIKILEPKRLKEEFVEILRKGIALNE